MTDTDLPALPQYVRECLRAYGDAREECDGTDAQMLNIAMLETRKWGATLASQPAAWARSNGGELSPAMRDAGKAMPRVWDLPGAAPIAQPAERLSALRGMAAAPIGMSSEQIVESSRGEWQAPQPAPAAVPSVPVATEAMLVAGLRECEPLGELIDWQEGFGRDEMRATYTAMIAAAPQAPTGAPE